MDMISASVRTERMLEAFHFPGLNHVGVYPP